MRSIMVLTLLLATTSLIAQDSNSDNMPTKIPLCDADNPAQPCVVAPSPISQTSPHYSDQAMKKKVEGTVYLTFVVGVDGQTHDVRVSKPLGSGLDEKAIECVNQWTFKPGTLEGNPTAVQLRAGVSFHIASLGSAH